MKFLPSIEDIRKVSISKKYDIMPVYTEIFLDISPMEALKVLKNVSTHCYMLESLESKEKWGRFTFLGYNPKFGISCYKDEIQIGDITIKSDNPKKNIKEILNKYKSPKLEDLPTFTGGLVGYFSYEFLKYEEPSSQVNVENIENFKDMDLMLFDKVIAFDNLKQKIILIVNIPLKEIETQYEKAKLELKQIASLLKTGEKSKNLKGKLIGDIAPLFNKEDFCSMVEKGKKYITEGDVFQIVLSNRLSGNFEGSLFSVYRLIRTINPSPYMFYFSGTDVEIAGASPETLVKLEDGKLYTFPLAGTRPRGKTKELDEILE